MNARTFADTLTQTVEELACPESYKDLYHEHNVGEQESVLDNGGRCVVAARFDSKDVIRHILQRHFIEWQRYNYFRQSNGYLVSLLLLATDADRQGLR